MVVTMLSVTARSRLCMDLQPLEKQAFELLASACRGHAGPLCALVVLRSVIGLGLFLTC